MLRISNLSSRQTFAHNSAVPAKMGSAALGGTASRSDAILQLWADESSLAGVAGVIKALSRLLVYETFRCLKLLLYAASSY